MQQPNNPDPETLKKIVLFLSARLRIPVSSLNPDSRLFHDLGVDGEDAVELLQLYSKEFNVELSHFNFPAYFGDEGTLSPLRLILRLFTTGKITEKKEPLTIKDLVNAVTIGELK